MTTKQKRLEAIAILAQAKRDLTKSFNTLSKQDQLVVSQAKAAAFFILGLYEEKLKRLLEEK